MKHDWVCINNCYYTKYDDNISRDTISFDLDDTILKRDSNEIMDCVYETLLHLHKQYDIVIFTNQMGISKNKSTHKLFQDRCNTFLNYLNIPIVIFYSFNNDIYRKPNTGMYYLCKSLFKVNILYFCGDASGREKTKDFSATDLYFANNCSIPYYTPEQIFLEKKSEALANRKLVALNMYKEDKWINGYLTNPRKIFTTVHIDNFNIYEFDTSNKLLIIMVGPPGSGKSTVSNKISKLYNLTLINNDTNNKSEINTIINTSNSNGFIIDNTNNTNKSRNNWLNKFSEYNKYIIHINISKYISIYLSKYREYFTGIHIPVVAIHCYYKKFESFSDDNIKVLNYEYPIVSNNIDFTKRFYLK